METDRSNRGYFAQAAATRCLKVAFWDLIQEITNAIVVDWITAGARQPPLVMAPELRRELRRRRISLRMM